MIHRGTAEIVRPRERWMNWRKEVGDCAARQETPEKDEGHSEGGYRR